MEKYEKIAEIAQGVKSKEDFINFVGALSQDFKNHSDNWENKTLDCYFESIQSWVEDMDGYYMNHNIPEPKNINWKVFADILIAAKMYE